MTSTTTTRSEICLELARAIALDLHVGDESPLPSVHLGIATLYSYLAQAGVLADGTARAELALERGLNRVLEGETSERLIGGLSGIGWMLGHLVGDGADPVCTTIDGRLERALDVPEWQREYDLVRGLAGHGVYAVTRLHHDRGRRIAAMVLDHLERMAEPAEVGLRWFTPAEALAADKRLHCPAGGYDLGLAHGMAGIAAMLARYLAAGFERDRSARLLAGCISFLLATPSPACGRFGAIIARGSESAVGTRMAWCYGDVGVALALFAAARALDRDDWEREALAVAQLIAARPMDTTGVVDASICHGSAGVAQFFHRLHARYPASGFEVAARAWIDKTIELRRPGTPLGGFQMATRVDGELVWSDNVSLLAGAPGTALALLAAATDLDPDWDEMLMFGS